MWGTPGSVRESAVAPYSDMTPFYRLHSVIPSDGRRNWNSLTLYIRSETQSIISWDFPNIKSPISIVTAHTSLLLIKYFQSWIFPTTGSLRCPLRWPTALSWRRLTSPPTPSSSCRHVWLRCRNSNHSTPVKTFLQVWFSIFDQLFFIQFSSSQTWSLRQCRAPVLRL